MLEIKNLHKFYGTDKTKTEVLRGINCVIPKGELCILLGPSGSGKSTLLNIIGGIEQGDEGGILFEGRDLLNRQTVKWSKNGYFKGFFR